MANIEPLLQRLEKVRQHGSGKWSACCPAHSDKSPSLSLCIFDNGNIGIHCFAGCEWRSVLDAVGLRLSDLDIDHRANTAPQKPLSREEWAYNACYVSVVRGARKQGKKITEQDKAKAIDAFLRMASGTN